jgi:hypothetical protein
MNDMENGSICRRFFAVYHIKKRGLSITESRP